MISYLYMLLYLDESFDTGVTNDLERRLEEHQNGKGANHTRKRLPVELIYSEEFDRIDEANYEKGKFMAGAGRKRLL